MIVVDRTQECSAIFNTAFPKRLVRILPCLGVRWLFLHKTSLSQYGRDNPHPVPDSQLDAVSLTRTFSDNPSMPPVGLGTGGRPPYQVLIRDNPDATAEQVLPLSVQAMHARGYNANAWAVAAVGDFDLKPPSDAMYRRIVAVVSVLMIANGGLTVTGHTDRPGASGDPNKRCPGKYLNAARIAHDALRTIPDGWQSWTPQQALEAIQAAGFRL